MSSAQVPAVVAAYFGCPAPAYADHPILVEAFTPGRGWVRSPIRKRVSSSWARKLRGEGVTAVAISYGGRVADFTIAEVVR